MTKTLESVVRRRWLPPEDAVRKVVAFERRFGKKHLALACHAALSLVLTPELVSQIRISFLHSENILEKAESDLLLSPLCRLIQEGVYEVEPAIREVLLVELENEFGWQQPFKLAEFLEAYLEKQPDNKQNPELTRTQKWIAQAYLDPDKTVKEIKHELDKSVPLENPVLGLPGQSDLPYLVEILAEPLQRTNLLYEHKYLVNNTRILAKLLSGEREDLKEEIGLKKVNNNAEKDESISISPAIAQLIDGLEPIATPPKVFISYSHDSQEHKDRVLSLADYLVQKGIDCSLDEYEQFPPQGWQNWMLDRLEWADFVLVVCTEIYNRRFRGQEKLRKAKVVTWEGAIISQKLYDAQVNSTKFIPIIFSEEDKKHIPKVIGTYNDYKIDSQENFDSLYRYLTNQHDTPKPVLGEIEKLPTPAHKPLFEPKSPQASDDKQKNRLEFTKFFAYDDRWVGRENLIKDLSNRVRESCRLLILVGITGIGKTALGERLAIELEDWFDSDWDKYLKEDFDNEEQSFDFASVAARLLEKCGEPVTPEARKDTQRLLNFLVKHLQKNRYLIQIDSLENILEGNEEEGWSEFKDKWWVEFFQEWLKLDVNSCESRIILTSEDLPAQLEERYKHDSYYQAISGLEKPEQLALFKKIGLDIESKEEDRTYLERIGNTYEGHPLALRVIAGEIVNRPFNKNVTAYWKRYGREVEEVEKAIEEAKSGGAAASADDEFNLHQYTRNLRRRVKTRLENTYKRLRKDVRNAYLLLCESSVYRCEVSEDFWLSHLEDWDIEEEDRYIALDALRDRFLVEEMVDESDRIMVRQHNLIRGVSFRLIALSKV